jgi:uncharacterized membrane protein YhiD involved in acid resistance
MAVGIACGVNSFANAVIGTVAFCLIAFFLRLTPYGHKNNLLGQLRFNILADSNDLEKAHQILTAQCRNFVLKRYRITSVEQKSDIIEYAYELRLQNEMQGIELTRKLQQLPDINDVRLGFNDTYINQYD